MSKLLWPTIPAYLKKKYLGEAMKKESNFPHESIAVIDAVLQLGRQERKYPDAFWRTLPMEEHVNSAKMHLTDFIYNTSPGEDHLAHALTRLAMAISVREAQTK